jgi:hypothetical protein
VLQLRNTEEQLLILELHSRWGNRWSNIAQHLRGRTDNETKNYWRMDNGDKGVSSREQQERRSEVEGGGGGYGLGGGTGWGPLEVEGGLPVDQGDWGRFVSKIRKSLVQAGSSAPPDSAGRGGGV